MTVVERMKTNQVIGQMGLKLKMPNIKAATTGKQQIREEECKEKK